MFRRKDSDETDHTSGSAATASSTGSAAASAAPVTSAPMPRTEGAPAGSPTLGASAAAPGSRMGGLMGNRMGEQARPGMGGRNDKLSARALERCLTVGEGISLEGGKISNCFMLVVDGKVKATLSGVEEIQISESGVFEGSAEIENAEIRGLFEGDLKVKGRLFISATGKVKGKISYGEIEIERGGELAGEIGFSDTESKAGKKEKQPVAA